MLIRSGPKWWQLMVLFLVVSQASVQGIEPAESALEGCRAAGTHRSEAMEQERSRTAVRLSEAHLAAVNRSRRLILHYDWTAWGMQKTPWGRKGIDQLDEIVQFYTRPYQDAAAAAIDSVFYEIGEGYPAMWPSNIIKRASVVFPVWWEAGIDPVEVLVNETRRVGREVFITYRINGADVEGDAEFERWKLPAIKEQHPDWLIEVPWGHPKWNFAVEGVRKLVQSVLCEIAELYNIDGLQLDFARTPVVLPIGKQWLLRDRLTDFMHGLREALLEIEERRGRPLLLAVRIPESILGCHFDGYEIERWIDEQLVDLIVPGAGAANIDIAGYRRLIGDKTIKIYTSWDAIHPTEGYREPTIEYWRGLFSKWWAQGADGVHIFNLTHQSPLLLELAQPKVMKLRDKAFIIERRSGGHGEEITGHPYNWQTPRHMFFMTYMLAPLPAILDPSGKVDTLLTIEMTDDVHAAADLINRLLLRVLVSDPTATELLAERRTEPARLWTFAGHPETNLPTAKGIEHRLEARINNLPLESPSLISGWLEFPVTADQLAVGDNLIGLRHAKQPEGHIEQVRVEKVELHVDYKFAKYVYEQD
jgi:hypothetical protein